MQTIINKIIFIVTAFILVFLFIEEIIEIRNTISLFEISPSFIIIGIMLIFVIPLLIGFIFVVPFILFTKKEKLKKTLSYILYLALSFIINKEHGLR